ncbi:MAG: hypothetical protein PUC32_05995, partial [Oscillospiraceae bacterium]|nr:hypothetical protein [Oscillospiraceae bacterium]
MKTEPSIYKERKSCRKEAKREQKKKNFQKSEKNCKKVLTIGKRSDKIMKLSLETAITAQKERFSKNFFK